MHKGSSTFVQSPMQLWSVDRIWLDVTHRNKGLYTLARSARC